MIDSCLGTIGSLIKLLFTQGRKIMESNNMSICSVVVHFADNGDNLQSLKYEYERFLYYKEIFDTAKNFTLYKQSDLAGGMQENGITDLIYMAENGKKVYLSIDGGFPIPEWADSDLRTQDCSEEMISQLVTAFAQYYNVKFARYTCPPSSDGLCLLSLYENP
jgi:hypothetical protein